MADHWNRCQDLPNPKPTPINDYKFSSIILYRENRSPLTLHNQEENSVVVSGVVIHSIVNFNDSSQSLYKRFFFTERRLQCIHVFCISRFTSCPFPRCVSCGTSVVRSSLVVKFIPAKTGPSASVVASTANMAVAC